MPPPDRQEYNPNIIGFVEDKGPVIISLNEARDIYGKLPSAYKLMPLKKGRENKKGLNLALGKLLSEKLKDPNVNLKKTVFDFFRNWHRDWKDEFGINIEPFCSLNTPDRIKDTISHCQKELSTISDPDLRSTLLSGRLIRKEILNSIPDRNLAESAERILRKRLKNLPGINKKASIQNCIKRIQAYRLLQKIKKKIGCDLFGADFQTLAIYADEIAKTLFTLSSHVDIPGVDELAVVRGQGVEFEFAERDITYLMLGKETGDCTADKPPFQADRDIENIYWTVFPWILDRNYQILKVYYNGAFIMKAHMLPLFIHHDSGDKIILAIDAVEAVRAFRDDLKGFGREDLLEKKREIFQKVLEKIAAIGSSMGIHNIYAEKFSNTKWVRNYLNKLPEIFLHVRSLIKIDELEDLFFLSKDMFADMEDMIPKEIFMEIQMKNTSLLPGVTNKSKGIKAFAVIKGSPGDGIPMKKIIGI
ncbi:MAG: hypothetical protein JRI61_09395 [Deltaproteobacteria bacterium]|nr:hypothetical protein [Deltaproteobacteria bacterium]